MARKGTSSGAGCGLMIVALIVLGIIGGIINLVGGGTDSGTTGVPVDVPSNSQPVAPSFSELPSDPDPGTDDGSGGGSVNLPGNGYVSGPGVNCSLGGCHAHVLPHFGFHF